MPFRPLWKHRAESNEEVFANHLKWKISLLLSWLNADWCYQKLHWTWQSQVSKLNNRVMHFPQVYLLLKENHYGPPRVTNSPQLWCNTTPVISIIPMMYAMTKRATVWLNFGVDTAFVLSSFIFISFANISD